jgi:hypothetical protein
MYRCLTTLMIRAMGMRVIWYYIRVDWSSRSRDIVYRSYNICVVESYWLLV